MSGARDRLLALYRAAIAGADIESLTADAVASIPLEGRHRVWVFAIGKAAYPMARAAVSTLQRSLAELCGGVVVGTDDEAPPAGTISAMSGDHPLPGPRSFAAATALQQVITSKRGTDLGIVLLSGGASSLVGAPLRGLEPDEYTRLFDLLLGSGLDIARMNAIRRRFSYWAAGRMALALAPARTFCFAVSDVPGDDLATVGSGPCVPDPTRVQRVIELLHEARLHDRIAPTYRQYLQDAARGAVPETPKESHPAFAHMSARVIANNSGALAAAAAEANREGVAAAVRADPLTGDAMVAGARLADALIAERVGSEPGATRCLIWGGETTMTLDESAPSGGRCQALALAAAERLSQAGDAGTGITLLAAGTDGRDGTTSAAGAIVDSSTWSCISAAGVAPASALRGRDAHRALASARALVETGPTGTNVMDVAIGLVERPR